MKQLNKILVVNVNWLGDVIFSSPVFTNLRRQYPDAYIACLAPSRVKEILECIPSIDEVIIFDEKGAHKFPWAKLALIMQIRRKKFDAVFLLHRSLTRALLVWLAGIPVRVGYDEKSRGVFLTHKVKPSLAAHRSDHYLNVIESFGINIISREAFLKVDSESIKVADEILKNEGIAPEKSFIAVHVGGNWDLKRWPKENWQSLISQLLAENKCQVLVTGAFSDISLIDTICSPLKIKPVRSPKAKWPILNVRLKSEMKILSSCGRENWIRCRPSPTGNCASKVM